MAAQLTPIGDSKPVHMVDEYGNFCQGNVDRIVNSSAELSAPNAPYAVISIVGAQSSGKSYLLNCLFGTKFPVMNAKVGRHRTSKGIMMSRCVGPSLLLLDVEGFDGIEKGQDTLFERQAALFVLAVSDLMMVNISMHNIGLEQAGGTPLFRTIFQERTKLQRAGPTKILVVVRHYDGKTPLEILRSQILESLEKTWESVNKESVKFKHYIIEVNIVGLPENNSPEFQKKVTELRRLLSKNRSAKIPASSFTDSSRIVWDTIKENKELDFPSHQEFIAGLFCRRLVEATLNSLDSLKDYQLLKVEESPSCFKERADALSESIAHKYNQATEMYHRGVRDQEHKYMVETLYKIFREDSRELIWKWKEYTSDNFKAELCIKNIQSMKEAELDSYGIQIVKVYVEKFMSSFQDPKVFDSAILCRICGDLKRQLQSHTDIHIRNIKEERARKQQERTTMIASLTIQAADTAAHVGNLVVDMLNYFGGRG